MELEKKISFGFSKLTKKPIVIQKPEPARQKIQLIDCLEGQTIKLKNAVKKEKKGPLVIPLQESKTIFDYQTERKVKQELKLKDDKVIDDRPDSELTPDELAARELLRDAQNNIKNGETPKVLSLMTVMQNTFQVEGKEEPSIDDYESVPISEYGLAMLRGMGWTETKGVGKIPGKVKFDDPVLRPKGLGLGANKLVNQTKEKQSKDRNGEELVLKKGGCAKIIGGKHKGSYCQVQGFDEDGRMIVKTAVKGEIINLNELLVTPVSKEEYSKLAKVINNVKYEEYKSQKVEESQDSSTEKRHTNKSRRSSSSDSKKGRTHSRQRHHGSRSKEADYKDSRPYKVDSDDERCQSTQRERKSYKKDYHNYQRSRSTDSDSDRGGYSRQKSHRSSKEDKYKHRRRSRSSSTSSRKDYSKGRKHKSHKEDKHNYL